LRTWGQRQKTRADYNEKVSTPKTDNSQTVVTPKTIHLQTVSTPDTIDSQTVSTTETNNTERPSDIAWNISKRLIAVVKVKSILNIEAGLEMIALGMAISSEVCVIEKFKYFESYFRLKE
jgi:hypothetical protein